MGQLLFWQPSQSLFCVVGKYTLCRSDCHPVPLKSCLRQGWEAFRSLLRSLARPAYLTESACSSCSEAPAQEFQRGVGGEAVSLETANYCARAANPLLFMAPAAILFSTLWGNMILFTTMEENIVPHVPLAALKAFAFLWASAAPKLRSKLLSPAPVSFAQASAFL